MKAFSEPIYVTRPLLPDLSSYTEKLRGVWAAKWLSNNGSQHQLLEKELCRKLEVGSLSLFNNGTIALMTALKALDLEGEVITTPFTFAATSLAISWNKLTPVFCDVKYDDFTLDPAKIEEKITSKTCAILPVHVFGNICDVQQINGIAKKHGLKVIYDAAHAFGSALNGKSIGTLGDITMFSFHPTKLFHTAEGGALTYGDSALKTRIDNLKNFGISGEDDVEDFGLNGKMNELSAVMGLLVLDMFEDERKRRSRIVERYRKNLEDIPGIVLPVEQAGVESSRQYYVIRIKESEFGKSRDEVYAYLKSKNVITRRYFYPLCSDFSIYRDLHTEDLPNAQEIVKETLSMPFYGELTDSDIDSICEIIIGMNK